MSRHGEITVSCWDGDYTFRLAYGELIKLQEACDAGAPYVADRLLDGNYRVEYIRETFRIALMGGGMSQAQALDTVRRHVEPHLTENAPLAWVIIRTSLLGAMDETLGKSLEAVTGMKASGFREERSPSPSSMALAQ